MNNEAKKINVFWFRRDLRFNDNTALYHALTGKFPVLAVFLFDKTILNQLDDKKDKRVSFIYKTLAQINAELQEHHSSLYVLHDTPVKAFEKICSDFDVKEVFTNHDYEPYAIERDAEIKSFLEGKNILFHTYKDQVIFERSEVMKPNGQPYTIFTPYSKTWKEKLKKEGVKIFSSEKKISNFFKTEPFHFPSLKDIGFEKINVDFPRLNISEKLISNYEATRNIPAIDGTSFASVYLRFGTVSVRELVILAGKLNEKWLNELI